MFSYPDLVPPTSYALSVRQMSPQPMHSEQPLPYDLLVVITNGSGALSVDGVPVQLIAGSAVVLRAGRVIQLTNTNGLDLWCASYHSGRPVIATAAMWSIPGFGPLFGLDPGRSRNPYPAQARLSTSDLARCVVLFTGIERELRTREPGWRPSLEGMLMQLVVTVSRGAGGVWPVDPAASARIAPAIKLLDHCDTHEIRIAELAAACNLCERHFRRTFVAVHGVSPAEFLFLRRVQEACRLLAQTDWTIGKVAVECGFCDSAYFSKKFREVMTMSPREYRATAQ